MVTCSGRSLWWVVCRGVLRFDRERATHRDDRKASQRWQCTPTDTEVDSNRSHRRWPITRERNRDRARADDQPATCQYLPPLWRARINLVLPAGEIPAPLRGVAASPGIESWVRGGNESD